MIFKRCIADLEINGIKIPSQITVEVSKDYMSPEGDFDFGDAKENAKYLARFRRLELFMAVITVTANAEGFSGADCLGACHIHSNNMFNSHPFNSDVESILIDHTMIENALSDLERNIRDAASRLKEYA